MNIKNDVKCIVWDLDHTIWYGILSEKDQIVLKDGVKDIITELDSRGILNSIASKNNRQDAMDKLEEFGLKEYFIYPEIHWGAKSKSVENIAKNLNINLDTFLFVDDQAFERDEVSTSHPSVECMDAELYRSLLAHPRTNPRFVTVDSKRRRLMYLEDMGRKIAEESFQGPPESFLSSLDMKFIISKAAEEDLKRAEELTLRTHQLNATGVTYNFDELNHFRTSDTHTLLICELIDRYGSYGKIGLALIEKQTSAWHLRLLLMSCRVMSRGVGTVLLSYILAKAKRDGKKMLADFKKTNRNRQMYVTYRFANFKELHNSVDNQNLICFENDLTQIQTYPNYIQVMGL